MQPPAVLISSTIARTHPHPPTPPHSTPSHPTPPHPTPPPPLHRRSIKKRPNAKSRKEGTPRTGESAPFKQRYTSSGHRQLLENVGLRENMLRTGGTRKSRKLSQLGRVTNARQTGKWGSEGLTATHACPFTCRQMFEYMYRGRFGRLYDVHGHKQPDAWEVYREIVREEAA